MTAKLPCHLLVGVPGSGKSTFAKEWVKRDPIYNIVSTDAIRDRLYGDETIQGHWPDIEAEVMRQIEQSIASDRPVIYDATNAQRAWRLAFLENVQQLEFDRSPQWIAWHFDISIVTCKQRNHQRRRVIPTHIIDEMAEYLHLFPPVPAEGFLEVNTVPLDADGWFDLSQVFKLLDGTTARVGRRRNRNSRVVWHPYARLIDFERLMYLLAHLLNGAVQQHEIEPTVSEIAASIAQKQGSVYGKVESISSDLSWLQDNNFFDSASEQPIDLEAIDRPIDANCHRYSDRDTFLRLLETIRSIVQRPFEYNPEKNVQESLVDLINARRYVTDRGALRKDLELALYPYGLLQRPHNYRRGYYLGTSIFSLEDLSWLYEHLREQGDRFSHPSDRETFYRVLTRVETLKPPSLSQNAPILRFGNPSIIEIEGLSHVSLARRQERVERAIRDRELLSLKRLTGKGKFPGDAEELRAYPLQLVFHNIAWYLGLESTEDGRLSFERLDRWYLKDEHTQVFRDEKRHQKSIKNLGRLLEASAGLFLGRSAVAQRQYLGRDRAKREAVTVTVELWCNENIFAFISEGTQRFPLKQMKMSPPFHSRDSTTKDLNKLFSAKRTGDRIFPHRFQVKLPIWSIEDIDFLRWIVGFGGQVKVIEPPELRERVLSLGRSIVELYETGEQLENPG
ncbi:MAG: WYL domain-containing protein [Cyanobacteria bacterium SID2]|nr:WYL domain-containing protein [Cyanobacteria bacterium SID2]MBP0003120.1 WYL domain-containing protein [Cyanobacteria bacterium SBC]